ncbi:MAG: ATP-binding protein [Bradymonadia bacterium]
MGVQTQSALIAAVLLTVMIINLVSPRRRTAQRKTFIGLLTGLTAYNVAFFGLGVSDTPDLWRGMMQLSALSIAILGQRFFDRFLERRDALMWRIITGASIGGGVLVFTRLGATMTASVLLAIYVLGVLGHCIWRLYLRYERQQAEEQGPEAQRLLYLVIGGAGALFFVALDLLAQTGLPVPTFGHLLLTGYMYLWMQVIQRSRLLDLNEMLGRMATVTVQALSLSLIYTGLVVWVGERYGLFVFNTFVATLVLVLLFEPLQRVLDSQASKLLFQQKFRFEQRIRRLKASLSQTVGVDDMVERVTRALKAARRIKHVAVYLQEIDGRGYFQARDEGAEGAGRIDLVGDQDFVQALRAAPEGVTRELLEREIDDLEFEGAQTGRSIATDRAHINAVLTTLERLGGNLCFPLIHKDRLSGFLVIDAERPREAFSSEEMQRWGELAHQMTIVIENSVLVEQLKERERLSALGQMAAGLAHEIRNPLGAIKGAAQMLEPDSLNEDEQICVGVILEEVDRLNVVVSQFLDYARPYRGALSPTDINRVIEKVAHMTEADELSDGVKVHLALDTDLPPILGDADQLKQVLLNLARNACEAMPEGGGLTFSTHLAFEEAPGAPGESRQRVEVTVADEGTGLPEGAREQLFMPFFTTRQGGTGLGLAISQRIVQQHGGSITVRPGATRGTVFSLRLPLADDAHALTGEFQRRQGLTNFTPPPGEAVS